MNPQARSGNARPESTPAESDTQRHAPIDVVDELAAMGLSNAVEIGRGGFGVVYRCVQQALDRVVAVKVLSSEIEVESRERFLREEQAMGRLSGHPNIVEILQVDVTPTGQPFIVMPFCTHGSLEQVIREQGPLSWADALRAGVKLAGAIESAHRAQILHRDVKPANVLLSGYGEPQLTDFGIARIPGGFQTSSSMITGSPAFTAPEVLKGEEPMIGSDIYGLGATLFALITGHAAFERQVGEKVVAQFLRITTLPVPDLREQDIPPGVADAIEQAMSTAPEQRPASAYEFGEMLRAVQRERGQMPDEMALLDTALLDAGDDDVTASGTDTSSRPRATVTARRSWPLSLRPAVSQHGGATSIPQAATLPPTAATKFRPPTPAREPVARANVNLRQSSAARTALGRLSNALARGPADDTEVAQQRCTAAVLAAADSIARDHTEGVLDRVADCLRRPDELPAWTVSTAANLTSFVRLCDFDFEGAREIQDWAAEYHARSKDPLGTVFGLCGQGAAAYEQLDIATATACFQLAWETAKEKSGPRSHAVRVSAALLGELNYRRGDLDTADRLFDESHQLVTRVGPVDHLIATFVIGARVKAVLGDLFTANARLDDGERIAADNRLARLSAHIRGERLRLGLLTDTGARRVAESPTGYESDISGTIHHAHRLTGSAALTAEAEEIAAIRALLTAGQPRSDDRAVRRARALHARMVEQHRPRAELDTALLLAESLAASGWVGEATGVLLPAAATCAELGWTRPLLDAGPGVHAILHVLRTEMRAGQVPTGDTSLPALFLDELLA